MVRKDEEGSSLIDFCSFTSVPSGRLAGSGPVRIHGFRKSVIYHGESADLEAICGKIRKVTLWNWNKSYGKRSLHRAHPRYTRHATGRGTRPRPPPDARNARVFCILREVVVRERAAAVLCLCGECLHMIRLSRLAHAPRSPVACSLAMPVLRYTLCFSTIDAMARRRTPFARTPFASPGSKSSSA